MMQVTNSVPMPALFVTVDHFRREVQAGGRSGDGAISRGKDGSVVGASRASVGAFRGDVAGRKRA
ncbi:MAG: hypothetical protein R3D02_11875 [Hyphomicrobiales bacterium]